MNHLTLRGERKDSKYIAFFCFFKSVYCTDLGVWLLNAGFVNTAKMRCPDEKDLSLQAPQDPKDCFCLSTGDKCH